jgi:hypothetical protein
MSYINNIIDLEPTYIGFGSSDGSNLLTGSANFIYSEPDGLLKVSDVSGNRYLYTSGSDGFFGLGNIDGTANGNNIFISDANDHAYYDNTAHTGKFGINTNTPDVALTVVGDAKITYPSAINFIKDGANANTTVYISNGVQIGDESGLYSYEGDAMIATYDYTSNKFYYGGTNSVTIDYSGGSGMTLVGINAPTPSVALDGGCEPI